MKATPGTKLIEVRIFVSYAHADPTRHKAAVESMLRWPGVEPVTRWSDHAIIPGSDADREIRAELARTDIFLALISPMFAASRYIHEVEVDIAKRRWRERTLLVVPLVVSHPGRGECAWLMGLECLPDKKKSWSEIQRECHVFEGGYDEGLKLIRDGVKKLVDKVIERKKMGKKKYD